jgi:predicted O-linked N-acetylglucosamine transferase (SPINDLY family)
MSKPMSPQKIQQLLTQAAEHHRAGRLSQAETLCREILAAEPKNIVALRMAGDVAYRQGRITEAIDLFNRALGIDPQSAVSKFSLGAALIAAGQRAEAELQLREAVSKKPDFVEAWDQLAMALMLQGKPAEAVGCHEQVIRLNPRYAPGLNHYGDTLFAIGKFGPAMDCYTRALASDPGFVAARLGRAKIFGLYNQIPESIEEYTSFLAKQPQFHPARSCRLYALQYLDSVSREQIFADHVAYGKAVGNSPAPIFPNTREPERPLRVAILSTDLRAHSCAFFLEPLLQHLDRSRFKLLLYLDYHREDAMSGRLHALSTVWRNVSGQPDPAVERTIRSDQPDILIDLAGHTSSGARLPLYARRIAPVQVTYLGYPDTTGLPAMDYRFTDEIADPAGEADRFATEKLVRFSPTAWAYQPPAEAPDPVAPPCCSRSPVTFGSFNNIAKINATTVHLWADVLRSTPGSRLLIKGFFPGMDTVVRKSFLKAFEAHGISTDRITLLDRTDAGRDHLAVYRRVDVALDTFPYHGTTTTCEALWMGVPVVTLRGDRHASRVGASLLTAVGHPEWIARDKADYIRIATELAAAPARLESLRNSLRDDMKRSPLLDHPGQAARFSAALRTCWIEWCRSGGPAVARIADPAKTLIRQAQDLDPSPPGFQ